MWTNVLISLEYMPKSEIAGSYSNSLFNFSRNCQSVLWNSCTILCYRKQYIRVLLFPYHCLHSLSSDFLVIAILVDRKLYLIVVSIWISLITNDVKHLSCGYWPFVYFPWRNVYLYSWPIFKLSCSSFYYCIVRVLNIFWILDLF